MGRAYGRLQGVGNVLYLDLAGGYLRVCVCTHMDKIIFVHIRFIYLLYVRYTSIEGEGGNLLN